MTPHETLARHLHEQGKYGEEFGGNNCKSEGTAVSSDNPSLRQPAVTERIIPQDLYRTFVGRELRKARMDRGWSQLRLSMEIGVESHVCIFYWEQGRTTPSAWMLDRLERLFSRKLRP